MPARADRALKAVEAEIGAAIQAASGVRVVEVLRVGEAKRLEAEVREGGVEAARPDGGVDRLALPDLGPLRPDVGRRAPDRPAPEPAQAFASSFVQSSRVPKKIAQPASICELSNSGLNSTFSPARAAPLARVAKVAQSSRVRAAFGLIGSSPASRRAERGRFVSPQYQSPPPQPPPPPPIPHCPPPHPAKLSAADLEAPSLSLHWRRRRSRAGARRAGRRTPDRRSRQRKFPGAG